MNKVKFLSIALLAVVTTGRAQDLNQAKKAIDAEQFESAKSILKSIIAAKPTNGTADFYLGNVYLLQNNADSAKIYYQKGLAGSEGARLNHIGLGLIDLDNGNAAAAEEKFALALKDIKKKDIEEYLFIGRAYTYSTKPDYKKALEYLNKAKLVNPQDAQLNLALGNAYYGDKNQNEAYSAYRNAYAADNTLIRAKMQLGVLLKGAKAYTEAIKAFDEVVAINPNYGPVFRELAETYYLWGRNEPAKYRTYIDKALVSYEKYLTLTDYSLSSRMRHADFLVLAGEYKALEAEANRMVELDKVNPRILRYLGISAYQNGNYDVAIKSLESFISDPANKTIAFDYQTLGFSKIKKAVGEDGKNLDVVLFDNGILDVKKSAEMDANGLSNNISDVGKKMYELKLFKQAGAIYEIAVANKESKNYVLDNFYLGNSLYFDNTRKDIKPDPIALQRADLAYGAVIEASPKTQDAYLYRARTNSLLENDEMTIKYYNDYINIVTEKGPEELAKPATVKKLMESYNGAAASYANTDKAKAIEYFNKTLTLDPANQYALDSLKALK
ncbi:tetratricopeptide repeat protein [Flavobacterium aquicola]|uniref:Tetratricopeptide repeat protein n=1 Tax=Flavobacterium aquicola TaxID=1682742 RepID=A0A3E0EF40_9FLAO|nr:tetratricopeptide repeat protein [Flavobacterium aquicola]REG96343.1 tetratricopeptide repeat protein [Flavobacterium aquicola]